MDLMEVTGEWRKFYNEELHNFYMYSNIIMTEMRMELVGHIVLMEKVRNVYQVLGR
jgi:hypothetical protein